MSAPRMEVESLGPLLNRLEKAREITDALFTALAPAALYERPIPERHRLVFYLGHLEAFDWNLLGRDEFGLEPHDAGFDKLFAFGIDPTHGDLPADRPEDWPREPFIRRYNQTSRRRLDEQIHSLGGMQALPPLIAGGTLLHVAIEHRLMHAETLAYLLHRLPYHEKRRRSLMPSPPAPPHQPAMVTIPRGLATLGQSRRHLPHSSEAAREAAFPFGWDNEFETRVDGVPEFRIAVFPVTNSQFLEFVRAGGYRDRALWSAEDWAWKESRGLAHPAFWEPDGNEWSFRGMFERVPLPPNCPVYASHAEAAAYARWAARSLPTEAQWHRAAYGTPDGGERIYPWGNSPPDHTRGNFNFAAWDPQPVTAHPAGASAFGVQDLLGNGWEWTSTPFAPLPGFQPFRFYRGYSADFFDGRHFVMKGGSARTAECLLRRPFRNWFQPRYPFVYATFRCVEG